MERINDSKFKPFEGEKVKNLSAISGGYNDGTGLRKDVPTKKPGEIAWTDTANEEWTGTKSTVNTFWVNDDKKLVLNE